MSVIAMSFGKSLRAGLNFSGMVRFLSLAVLAGGLAVGGVSSAKAATFIPLADSPLTLDNFAPATLIKGLYSDDYACGGGACGEDGIKSTVETELGVTPTAFDKYEGLSGGTDTEFTFTGLAHSIFAIKSGDQLLALLHFSDPVTGWTIKGFSNDISNIVGLDPGLNPIPLPPAALLFLTGLAGMGLLARRRRAKLGGAAA